MHKYRKMKIAIKLNRIKLKWAKMRNYEKFPFTLSLTHAARPSQHIYIYIYILRETKDGNRYSERKWWVNENAYFIGMFLFFPRILLLFPILFVRFSCAVVFRLFVCLSVFFDLQIIHTEYFPTIIFVLTMMREWFLIYFCLHTRNSGQSKDHFQWIVHSISILPVLFEYSKWIGFKLNYARYCWSLFFRCWGSIATDKIWKSNVNKGKSSRLKASETVVLQTKWMLGAVASLS